MKLYHGTSAIHLSSILRDGLKPRGTCNSTWTTYPSNPNMVYLTTAYPFFFALHTSADDNEIKIVFEIDSTRLHADLFMPDEDMIAQVVAKQLGKPLKDVHDAIRDGLSNTYIPVLNAKIVGDTPLWHVSLSGTATCCYNGVIPPSAMTRYCLFDWRQRGTLTAMLFNSEPYLGGDHESHRKLTQWMFGDRRNLPRFIPFQFVKNVAKNDPQTLAKLRNINYREEEQSRRGIEVRTIQGRPFSQ